MKCVLNISLLFMIAILGCSMTMQAECVVEYGYDVVKTNRVYSYPNTDMMLCFDSDSTFLYGQRGSECFEVYRYRQEVDSIKAREWLSCSYKNGIIKVECDKDTVSVDDFLIEAENDTIIAELIYSFYQPRKLGYKIKDDKILTKYSHDRNEEELLVCTNATIEDFYYNILHYSLTPYECFKHPTHTIPSSASLARLRHSGNKIRLYYSHEELLYAYKFLSDYPKKKIKKFGSLERVRLAAEGENLYFEPILIESAEVDRELFITIIYDFSAKRWDNEVYITDVNTLKSSCYLTYSAGNNEDVTNKELRRYYEMISPYIDKWKAKGIKKFKYEDEKSEYFTFAMHLWLMPIGQNLNQKIQIIHS